MSTERRRRSKPARPRDGVLLKLAPVPGRRDTWQVAIAGTVSDPAVTSGVPGSGVRSVKVTLLDGYGRPAGDGTQLAAVSGTAWTAEVTLTDPIDDGAYTIQAEADDQAGNVISADAGDHLPRPHRARGQPGRGCRLAGRS